MIFGHSHPLPLHRNAPKDHRGNHAAYTPASGLAITQNCSSLIVQKSAASKSLRGHEFRNFGLKDPTLSALFPTGEHWADAERFAAARG